MMGWRAAPARRLSIMRVRRDLEKKQLTVRPRVSVMAQRRKKAIKVSSDTTRCRPWRTTCCRHHRYQPWPCVTVVTYVFFSGHK